MITFTLKDARKLQRICAKQGISLSITETSENTIELEFTYYTKTDIEKIINILLHDWRNSTDSD